MTDGVNPRRNRVERLRSTNVLGTLRTSHAAKIGRAIETSTHRGASAIALFSAPWRILSPGSAPWFVSRSKTIILPGNGFCSGFKEKGGKEKELTMHHKLEELLNQYLKATGLEKEPRSPLFPVALGKTGKLSRWHLVRTDAADMLKHRSSKPDYPLTVRLTHFRRPASRIFWKMTAPLKPLIRTFDHADSRTTKLYDRRGQKVLLEDMERIRY
jgi:hypothetical protein